MNKVVIGVLLVSTIFCFRMNVDSTIQLRDSYELECDGAVGEVTYRAENLPPGIKLEGNVLVVEDASLLRGGYETCYLEARDQAGNIDERLVIIITVKAASEAQTQQTAEAVVTQPSAPENSINHEEVTTLLDNLNIPSTVSEPKNYPENRYPSLNFPTGANENVPNYVPQTIQTQQARPSDQNRNQITAEDVRSQSIFQRQLNAAKALANLLDIIKQATANKNAAAVEIQSSKVLYEEAIAVERAAEESIFQAENDLARIKKGIDTSNQEINRLRETIDELTSQREQKQLERESLLVGLENANKNLNIASQKIQKENANLVNAIADSEDKQRQCQELEVELKRAEERYGSARLQWVSLGQESKSYHLQLQRELQEVEALKRQLAVAEEKAQNTQGKIDELNAESSKLNQVIEQNLAVLNDLSSRIEKCKTEHETIQRRIESIELTIIPQLYSEKEAIEAEISKITAQVSELKTLIDSLPQQIMIHEDELDEYLANLQYLRSQTFLFENKLLKVYSEGNVAKEKARVAYENLNAANERYLRQVAIIEEATRNIEQARIEKEQADQAVENYLQEGVVNLLPFPAAPENGGYVSSEAGQYGIESYADHVTSGYGASVKPLFVGDLKTLYSFRSGQGTDSGECNEAQQRSISGYILQVSDSSFNMITEEGDKFEISLAPCALGLSNIQNYSFAPGDIAVLKGTSVSSGGQIESIKATQMTCIRR